MHDISPSADQHDTPVTEHMTETAEAPVVSSRRDADSARKAAADRIETAKKIAGAVDAYHNAADRIDAAQAELRDASTSRTNSLRELRNCGLTVSEISALTGLSSSRVQSLLQG